jgi:hypothetical protein
MRIPFFPLLGGSSTSDFRIHKGQNGNQGGFGIILALGCYSTGNRQILAPSNHKK